MFGRSHEDATPVMAPANPSGGRMTAISILPGVPLPPDLVQPAPEAAYVPGPDATDERELVTAGAPSLESGATSGFVARQDAPAKRSSFLGLRLRGKGEPEDPSSFFGDDPGTAPEPVHTFAAPVVVDAPPAFAAPPADAVAFEAPAPIAPPAPPAFVPEAFVPTAPPTAPPTAVPTETVLQDASFTEVPPPPVYVPLDTPVHTAVEAPAPVEAPVAAAPARGLTAFAQTFVDRVRGGSAEQAPTEGAAHAEDPFAHTFAPARPDVAAAPAPIAAPAPPPYVAPAPGQAEVVMSPPPPPPYAPPAFAADSSDAPSVPAFAHLVPSHQIAFPDQLDEMATQVAAQVAQAPAVPQPGAPTVGLVFADGSHAELGEGPDGAALQQVARVLAGDSPAAADGATDPNE